MLIGTHTELFSDDFDQEIVSSTVDVEDTVAGCEDCAVFIGQETEVAFAALAVQGKQHQKTRTQATLSPTKTIQKKKQRGKKSKKR